MMVIFFTYSSIIIIGIAAMILMIIDYGYS